jgi:sugar lactone lactonase YvrE
VLVNRSSFRYGRPLGAGSLLALALLAQSQSQLQVGYAVVTASAGSGTPVGSVLFSFTNPDGVLVSQAGVGGAEPLTAALVFVDEAGTQTALALANAGDQDAAVTLTLRDSSGREASAPQRLALPARRQTALYVSELFSSLPAGFTGSLGFESDQKLAAVALRESRNSRAEPLYSSLPVIDTARTPASTLVFPQIAAGAGYSTQIVLLNPSTGRITGQIDFTDSAGSGLAVRSDGRVDSSFSYQIEPRGAYRATFDRPSGLAVGSARVVAGAGSIAPVGTAIFQFKQVDRLVTEAGVAATPGTTSARIFVDNAGSYTGVAIANPEGPAANVTFTLLDRYGTAEGTATRTIPPRGQLSIFAHELFPNLSDGYTGTLEIASTSAINAITLKLTTNALGEQVLTTLPVADLDRPPGTSTLIFPQVAIGQGFSTRLILINGSTTARSAGTLGFFRSDGTALVVPLADSTGSRFSYDVAAGGSRQLFPGNSAKAAAIRLLDASSYAQTQEVAVNEGKTQRARVVVVDTLGTARDDFEVTFRSVSTDVATIDATGLITGKKAGFSTLVVSAGAALAQATITVATVSSGESGFEATGVVQDLSRRLYLASTAQHAILLAQDLNGKPTVYAGVSRTAGLRNDVRLESLFKNPAFLALHQAEGSLYVSDAANHVIRRVAPGATDRVETLAGTSSIGSRDGALKEAQFNNPQGIVLDGRFLWVADSGNHTIRRIDLLAGTTETIAGKAGSAGWADGSRESARFSSPVGLAVESEPLAARLERERRGDPPPPVQILVADKGNGVIRRVKGTGEVETIRGGTSAAPSFAAPPAAAAAPASFRSPSGIAVDPLGTIYVTEPEFGRVRALLKTGDLVTAVQPNTVKDPSGMAITQEGRVLVADRARTAVEIVYGEPRITVITPDRVASRAGTTITIHGKNFAPDSVVIVAGAVIESKDVRDSETISFTAPVFPSGRSTVTVLTRGGLAQSSLRVDPIALDGLPAGSITTIAGGTTFAGDGAAAASSFLALPWDAAFDSDGNILIADQGQSRIRRIDARTGIITTVAGRGHGGILGDGDLALTAGLAAPHGLTVDPVRGDIYIADTFADRVRKVAADTGIITTVAGDGRHQTAGDGGPATAASVKLPRSVAVDALGNLYIAQADNNLIRRVDAVTGIIRTIAGRFEPGYGGDGGPAADALLDRPIYVSVDGAGNLFIADQYNNRIRKITAATGIITTVAGNGRNVLFRDNIPALEAELYNPMGVAVDSRGNIFIDEVGRSRIRRVDAVTGVITTVAGSGFFGFAGDGGLATAAGLQLPRTVAVDAAGTLVIADSYNNRVRRVDGPTRIITTIAGNRTENFAGDNGPAAAAVLFPSGVAVDSAGNIFIADTHNCRVRRVDASSLVITSVAGDGTYGRSSDGVPAAGALLWEPQDVAVDTAGNVVIADSETHRIRKIDRTTGLITTVAGNVGPNFSGDGGPGTAASLSEPAGIAFDSAGNLFIADTGNHRVRRVDAVTKVITTVAGSGDAGYGGDDGPATSAKLNAPARIAVDRSGNIFISDSKNLRVRKVAAATGTITTVAGTGLYVPSGDNGLATKAAIGEPRGITFDAAGNLYFAAHDRIRRVDAATGTITTVAGNGTSSLSGDGGPATAAGLTNPEGIAFTPSGDLLISDTGNNRVRVVRGPIR